MKRFTAPQHSRIFFSASIVWLVLAAAQTSLQLSLGAETPWWMVAVLQLAHALAWTTITLGVRWWGSLLVDRPRVFMISGHLLALIVAGVTDALVRRSATELLGGEVTVSLTRTLVYFADVTTLSYILAVWTGRVIDAKEALVAQTRHDLALRAQLSRARLNFLHAQLQPHFLFNALGTVSELIFENPAVAVRTFRQLGAVMRAGALLDSEEIPLREEVEALRPYLDVQRTRFSDWLAIELEIASDAENLLVPPLILQPLVENSIRHGLRNRESRGEISIIARVENERLVLRVRDNGAGLHAGNENVSGGVGLSNTSERLRTLYGGHGSLRLFRDQAGGTVAEVSIPARSEASVKPGIEALPEPAALPQAHRGLAFRHPLLTLIGGSLLASALWTQQSYAYLTLSGRLGDRTALDLALDDMILIAAWAAMVPAIAWLSRLVPIAGNKWVFASMAHMAALAVFALAHSWAVYLYRTGGSAPGMIATFRGTAPITLLLYVCVVAYTHRRILEEWLVERQLGALRVSQSIMEANIAAATMAVSAESFDCTLADLERYASDDPLKAEHAIALLGSELRSTLEARLPAPVDDVESGGRLFRGEHRVEGLAVGA